VDTKFGEDARQEVSMDKTRKTSKRRPRRSFTPEFKAEAVRLCRIGDLKVSALASAMRARGSPRGVLVHSDGGGIYGDEDY
jgi:hypothetical protein